MTAGLKIRSLLSIMADFICAISENDPSLRRNHRKTYQATMVAIIPSKMTKFAHKVKTELGFDSISSLIYLNFSDGEKFENSYF